MGSVNRLRTRPRRPSQAIRNTRGRHLRAAERGRVKLRAQTEGRRDQPDAKHGAGHAGLRPTGQGHPVPSIERTLHLRGRYGEAGRPSLNLSKSGVSVSSTTELGTINLFKPGYSSIKLGGVAAARQKSRLPAPDRRLLQLARLLDPLLRQAPASYWFKACGRSPLKQGKNGWRRLNRAQKNLKNRALEPDLSILAAGAELR